MKATLEVFPDAQIKGCFFHFCQCLWRKLQGLGLAVAYKEMPEIRTWFRMVLALPMLPVAQVVDGFNLVKERSPDVLRIQEFNDYLFTTWGTGFPIEMWNYFRYDGPRTNNHVGIPQSAEEKSRESPPKPLWNSGSVQPGGGIHIGSYAAGAGRSASPQKKENVWQYWLPFAPVRLRLHDMPQNDGVLYEGGWPYDGQYWS